MWVKEGKWVDQGKQGKEVRKERRAQKEWPESPDWMEDRCSFVNILLTVQVTILRYLCSSTVLH